MKISPLLLLLGLVSCSHTPKTEKQSDIPQSAFQSTDPNQITIAIVGMNDFHGHILPSDKRLPDGRVVQSGGASALYSMLSILKSEMNGRMMIVDAGDEWQGTLESNSVKGASVVDFYNRLGVKVAAIGNHEFDFTVPTMTRNFARANYPYVAANIFEKKSGKHPSWKNVFPSRMFDLDGVRVGVVGASTVNTPTTTRAEFVKPYEFKDPVLPVTQEAQKLKKAGADLVLLTAHAGTVCEDNTGLKDWSLRTPDSPQSKCDERHEIYEFAKKIKPGTLDGIVAGHTHQIIHHWLNQIPVVQGEMYNQYFNVIYYTFDRTTKKLIPELTRIEGLVPICSKVFEGTHHCDSRRFGSNATQYPQMVAATFHGKTIEPDPAMEVWLNPLIKNVDQYKKQVVTVSELPLTHSRFAEGALGNAVADAVRAKTKADFALVNSGGIRTALDAGEVTVDGLFRAMPFDNLVYVVRMKGRDVKMLYQVATSGSRGITLFSGLKLKLIPYDQKAPQIDLDQNGKLEMWETNRLVDIRTSDGKVIDDNRTYTIATLDFLVEGGDDVGFVMKKVPPQNVNRSGFGFERDVVADYLKQFKVINTKDHPLVDPQNPRVEFVK